MGNKNAGQISQGKSREIRPVVELRGINLFALYRITISKHTVFRPLNTIFRVKITVPRYFNPLHQNKVWDEVWEENRK
jgi:16S rRNA U516 pseudouridylate synthase RsuA-like enzyme